MGRFRAWLCCSVIAACGTPAAPVSKPHDQQRAVADAGAHAIVDGATTGNASAPVSVLWGNVRASEGCFFFSGPLEHGRDETLGNQISLDESRRHLALGAAIFERVEDDDEIIFARTTERFYEGKWTVTERVTGAMRDDAFVAHYVYEECDLSGNQGCPTTCSLTADFTAYGFSATP